MLLQAEKTSLLQPRQMHQGIYDDDGLDDHFIYDDRDDHGLYEDVDDNFGDYDQDDYDDGY